MPETSHPFINIGSSKSPLAHPVALGSLAVSLICRYYAAVAVVVAVLLPLLLTLVDVLVLGAEENRLEASSLAAHEKQPGGQSTYPIGDIQGVSDPSTRRRSGSPSTTQIWRRIDVGH